MAAGPCTPIRITWPRCDSIISVSGAKLHTHRATTAIRSTSDAAAATPFKWLNARLKRRRRTASSLTRWGGCRRSPVFAPPSPHSPLPTPHTAGPNKSDGMREAFAIIYTPHDTGYDGKKHVVIDPLNLAAG